MSALVPIDSTLLDTVTAGAAPAGNGSTIDSLLGELHSMTGAIDNIKNKTSGLDQGSMFVLCLLAMRRQSSVVVVGQRPGYWW